MQLLKATPIAVWTPSQTHDHPHQRLSLQLHTSHTTSHYTITYIREASPALVRRIEPVPRQSATRPHTPRLGRPFVVTSQTSILTTRPLPVFEAERNAHIEWNQ